MEQMNILRHAVEALERLNVPYLVGYLCRCSELFDGSLEDIAGVLAREHERRKVE